MYRQCDFHCSSHRGRQSLVRGRFIAVLALFVGSLCFVVSVICWCRARSVAQHFTFGVSREGGACLCPRNRFIDRNGLCVCLPLCQRCFPQAPQVGGGDSGEELEDKSQESASSDTEPEEPAGPAGINAVGPSMLFVHVSFQTAWCVVAPALAKSCLGRAARRACQGGSGIIGKAAQDPSPLFAWWHLYMMSGKACWMQLPQTRFSPVARVGLAL